jgi:hypothetical protein
MASFGGGNPYGNQPANGGGFLPPPLAMLPSISGIPSNVSKHKYFVPNSINLFI